MSEKGDSDSVCTRRQHRRVSTAMLALAAFSLSSGSAQAGDPDELEKIWYSAETVLPIELQLEVVRGLDAGDTLTSSETVKLLRSGVPSVVLWTYSKGKHPTDEELALGDKIGEQWTKPKVPAPSAAPVERTAPDPTPAAVLDGPDYHDGHPFWTYSDANLQMRVAVMADGGLTHAMVSVTNIGNQKVTLFPSSFSLDAEGATSIAPLRRLEPSAYMKRLFRRGTFRTLLVALSTPTASSTVSRTTGSISDSRGGGASFETTTTTEPSTAERIAARQYADAQIDAAMKRERERLQTADDLLLRAETLVPGETLSGVVPFKYKSDPGERFQLRFEGLVESVPIELHVRN